MKKEFTFSLAAGLILLIAIIGLAAANFYESKKIAPAITANHYIAEPATSTDSDTDIYRCKFTSEDKITSLDLCDYMDRGISTPGLSNPFILNGTTTVFENQFNYEIVDDNNAVVGSGFGYASSPDSGLPGPFVIRDFFDAVPTTSTGKVQIIDYSPKDGSKIVLLSAPVHFYPETFKFLNVYFSNNQKDPQMLDCSNVYAVKRKQAWDAFNLGVLIHELLKGPTDAEKDQGYLTSLPEGVNDPEITFDKDTVYLDFDDTLEKGVAGSCRVLAIRTQIETTIKNTFPLYKVVISINGRTEDILQP